MAIPMARPPVDHLDPDAIFLVVEGPSDLRIASHLMEAAGYPLERVKLLVGSGKHRAAREVADLAEKAPGRCAVLVDLDERSVPDARRRAREQLGNPPAEVFCGVPAVEAWLFADDRAAISNADPDEEVQ